MPDAEAADRVDLGELVTEIVRLRQEYEAKNAAANEAKKRLNSAKENLAAVMQDQGIDSTSIRGLANVSVNTTNVPYITGEDGWEGFYEYVKENDAFYLLQKRLSTQALREMVESGEKVPGVEMFEKVDVSIRKI